MEQMLLVLPARYQNASTKSYIPGRLVLLNTRIRWEPSDPRTANMEPIEALLATITSKGATVTQSIRVSRDYMFNLHIQEIVVL